MPENNQILSVESQLVGLPLAGPESFSAQQLDYLKTSLGLGDWTDVTSGMTKNTGVVTQGGWFFYYNKVMKLISIIGIIRATAGDAYTIPEKYRPLANFLTTSTTGATGDAGLMDYTASTGKFTARSGTNHYFSIYCTLPCTGE